MIIKGKISKESLEKPFSKAAVDVKCKIVALGGELHIDCVEELTSAGSAAADIWGVNIYPDGHLDFISLVNVRPAQGNRSMDILDEKLRNEIGGIVSDILE